MEELRGRDPDLVISADGLQRLIHTVLTTWGLATDAAATAAHVMADTDLAGVDSHGIAMLPAYGDFRLQASSTSAAMATSSARGRRTLSSTVEAVSATSRRLGRLTSPPRKPSTAASASWPCGIHTISVPPGTMSHEPRPAAWSAWRPPRRGSWRCFPRAPRYRGWAPIPSPSEPPLARICRWYWICRRPRWPVTRFARMPSAISPSRPGGCSTAKASPSPMQPMHGALIASQSRGGLSALGGREDMGDHKGYGLAIMVQVLAATLSGAAFSPCEPAGPPTISGTSFLRWIRRRSATTADHRRYRRDDRVSARHAAHRSHPPRAHPR